MNTFYFFGDSITLGVNVLPKDSFVSLIFNELTKKIPIPPTTLYNLGVRKNSTKNIFERLDLEFNARNLAGSTPYFFFMCGVVDTVMAEGKTILSLEESKQYLHKIISFTKEKGQTIFLSPTPVNNDAHTQRIHILTEEQEKICKENNIPYINLFKILYQKEYLNDLKDAIHPNEIGNKIIADEVIKQLHNILSLS